MVQTRLVFEGENNELKIEAFVFSLCPYCFPVAFL